MQNNSPSFEVLRMAPENTNSVLVTCDSDAVIFDAWGRADAWNELLASRKLNLRSVYSTHGHPDHISAAPELAAAHNIPWFLNACDNLLLGWGAELLEYFGLPAIDVSAARPNDLPAGEFEILPGVWMHAIAAPGHSAGGMMFHFPDFKVLIAGDTIFADSVGRCDLPGGDMCALRATIARLREMNLPDDTFVVFGHGMNSTIEMLKRENPYFVANECGRGHCCHGGDCCGGHKCCKD